MGKNIEAICEKEFGMLPDRYGEVTGGLMNETVRIIFEDKTYILQLNSRTEPCEMENCLNWFESLKDSPVPVPELITNEVKSYESESYIIVQELPGFNIEDRACPRKALISGKYLAHIHNHRNFDKTGWFEWKNNKPVPGGFPDESLRGRTKEHVEGHLEFFKQQEIEWLAEIAERFLDDYLELVPKDFEPVLCHNDYSPRNILFEDKNLTGIVDFDYAYSSHAQRDIAKAANNFWIREGIEREYLYEGYKQIRRPEDSFERNEPVYRLETFLDILKGMIELDRITSEQAKEYTKEFEEMERRIKEKSMD